MATLMEFIVAQSSLGVGNTVRDHIENPSAGGGPSGFIMAENVAVEIVDDSVQVELVEDIIYVTIKE